VVTELAPEAAFGFGHPDCVAALEYVCRKLPPDEDNPAIRKHIAAEIVAACQKGQTSHEELASVGLKIVNSYLFPPGRAWLKTLGG